MANLGSASIGYVWRFTRFIFRSVFRMSNITVPLKFLASLLFGYKYLSKKEQANERLLKEDFKAHFGEGQNNNANQSATKKHTWRLIKHGKFLGLSKMLIKSMIFAIAGICATLVIRLINKRKA